MTAAEGSFIGFAKQTAKGTPNVTDANFQYLLMQQGAISPSNVVLPLDPEIGGGPLIRDVKKVGVTSGGAMEFIPRPATLGAMLLGALGLDTPVANGAAYDHVFTFNTDPFALPYYTFRVAPGNIWGEQYQDCKISSLSLNWRGANFLRGQLGIIGGLPAKVATTTWSALTYLDSGPQFISPVATMELPTGTPVKVLSGSLDIASSIPMDEQWIVGSYSPDDQQVAARSLSLSLVVKIVDATLYSKVMYDSAGGSAWTASMMREANINMNIQSDQLADTGKPYNLVINANGNSGATANIIWACSPIGLRAGKQVIMSMNGMIVADPTVTNKPISIKLTNKTATY